MENLQNVQNDLLFLPERMAIEKVEKNVANLHDKNEYGIHMKNSKQALITEYIWKKCIELLNLIKSHG